MDEPSVVQHDDLDPPLLQALGKIVYHWAYVEMLEGAFLAHLLNADQGLTHVVTQNVSGATLTDWLRTLVQIRFKDDETRARISDLLSRIDTARGERNAFVHGLWTQGDDRSLAEVTTIKWDRAEVMRHEVVSANDLDGFVEEIGEIYTELLRIGDVLGFHPQRR